ncbi:hypothetical protein [Myroides marinus]|uniref:hypothetical protein n=1 Tax=Myroides marinus TaxID=703342 RepID=UPI002576C5CA|nr:hypothetical protein [Myroides marinus]MDM1378302.1 hypothetical protein [Myroides marinus]MDM1385664.1 hypothetical protein [Myroides marinus]MDM1392786.1 hypothetical protein [Myroides marinus]
MQKKIVIRGVLSSLPMLLGIGVLFVLAEGKGVFLIPFFSIVSLTVYTIVYLIFLICKRVYFNKIEEQNIIDFRGFLVYVGIMFVLVIMELLLFG